MFQFIKCRFGCILGYGPANPLQINHECLLVLGGHVAQLVVDLVDNAKLHLGLRKYGVDGIRKAGQAIHRGDQDILDAKVVQAIQHRLSSA